MYQADRSEILNLLRAIFFWDGSYYDSVQIVETSPCKMVELVESLQDIRLDQWPAGSKKNSGESIGARCLFDGEALIASQISSSENGLSRPPP